MRISSARRWFRPKATLYGDRKSAELAYLRDDERPAGIQLFGSEPDVMAKAAERVAVYRPLYIDINMGCPVHKVFANGEGSALMKDIPKAAEIVRAVAGATDIPVGVKMRLGVDDASRNAPALAEAVERAGAAFPDPALPHACPDVRRGRPTSPGLPRWCGRFPFPSSATATLPTLRPPRGCTN